MAAISCALWLVSRLTITNKKLISISENRELHERRYGLSLQVFAIGDSSGYIASKDASIPLPDSAVLVSDCCRDGLTSSIPILIVDP